MQQLHLFVRSQLTCNYMPPPPPFRLVSSVTVSIVWQSVGRVHARMCILQNTCCVQYVCARMAGSGTA